LFQTSDVRQVEPPSLLPELRAEPSPNYPLIAGIAAVLALAAYGVWASTRTPVPSERTDPQGTRRETSSTAVSLEVRPVPDPGSASLDAGSKGVDWSISIRTVTDDGRQALEPPQPAVREDGNG
jgi:hypothetical protein